MERIAKYFIGREKANIDCLQPFCKGRGIRRRPQTQKKPAAAGGGMNCAGAGNLDLLHAADDAADFSRTLQTVGACADRLPSVVDALPDRQFIVRTNDSAFGANFCHALGFFGCKNWL